MGNIEIAKDLAKGIVDETEIQSRVETYAPAPDLSGYAETSQVLGFKNYIINGGFDVWQRGTSTTSISNGYLAADRWQINHAVAYPTATVSRQTATTNEPFNTKYFHRYDISSLNGCTVIAFQNKIEGGRQFEDKTFTISFYARSTVSQSISIDSGYRTASTFTDTVLTSYWKKFTGTLTFNTDLSGNTFVDAIINFFNFSGTGYIDVAQVQLEEGSVATPFEQRPIGLELSLCQRYYQKETTENTVIYDNGYGMNREVLKIPNMRIAPSVTITNYTFFGHESGTPDFIFSKSNCIGIEVGSSNSMCRAYGVRSLYTYTADAEL